jgi:hypothetical protein
MGGRRIERDFELVLCDCQERIIGNRCRRIAVDDCLKVLQGFRVFARPEELEAARVLPARELLRVVRRLCLHRGCDHTHEHQTAQQRTSDTSHPRLRFTSVDSEASREQVAQMGAPPLAAQARRP